MKSRLRIRKSSLTLSAAMSVLIFVSLVAAQELVPVRDLTGASSVFIFRGVSKSVSKRFVTQSRAKRSVQQRADSARRVNTQFTKLAKIEPRRARVASVNPDDPKLKKIATMPKEEASKLFAGVGEYHMDRNAYDSAIDFFREAFTMDPSNAVAKAGLSEALALKGNELLARNSTAIAKRFFEEALSYNPRNSPAFFGLAEVLSDSGNEAEALVNYEKALEYDGDLTEIYIPLGILYYQQNNLAKSDELLSKAIGIDANDAQAQHFLGLIRLQQGRNEEAAAAFGRAKTADPGHAEAFYYSGEAMTRLGNREAAIEDFRKAIAIRENYFEAWYGLGTALFESENYAEAVKAFERAKRLRNDNAEVVANLGDAYRLSDDPALASNRYNLAESNYNLAALFLERRPDFATNTEIRQLTADIYARIAFAIGKQCEINIREAKACKWDVAIKALARGAEISKSDMDFANLGWAFYNAGRADLAFNRQPEGRANLEKARDSLIRSIDANPNFLDVPLSNLGKVYSELGDHRNSIATFKKVVDRDPRSVSALNDLGVAYLKAGNFKDAVSQLKKAVDRDDKFADGYLNLGLAEFKNGNLDAARKAHARLRAIGRPDLATMLEKLTGGAVKG